MESNMIVYDRKNQRGVFFQRVIAVVRAIPAGSVMTYKQVASAAGSPRACRAVGSMMKKNVDPTVPCHRVVRSDGNVGEYNQGGSDAKKKKLIDEGAIFEKP